MALQDVLDAADNRFQQHWPKVVSGQEDYLDAYADSYVTPQYWQGTVSHSASNVPADGNESEADRLTDKPPGVPITWGQAMSEFGLDIGPQWLQALEIHVYYSRQGRGFIAIRRLKHAGTEYVKRVNEGPLTHRGHDWREAAPDATQ